MTAHTRIIDARGHHAVQGQVADAVRAAVESLDPVHRDVLEQVYFAGRTAADAAERLDLPIMVVKVRVHDAMQQLRQLLLEYGALAA